MGHDGQLLAIGLMRKLDIERFGQVREAASVIRQ